MFNNIEIYPLDHRIVNKGDKIKWEGIYFSGYLTGTNIVTRVFLSDTGTLWARLDNDKELLIGFTSECEEIKTYKNWKIIK